MRRKGGKERRCGMQEVESKQSAMKRKIREILSRVIGWRRDLHQMPEIGNELPQTADYICSRLKETDIEYRRLMDGNAVVGVIRGAKAGRTIALRADMDALPIAEETGLPFASKNGNMHACGHDAHAAMLLGAARLLQQMREDLEGNILLLFQPGEEYPGGADPMIREGALEDPKPDAILGLHCGDIGGLEDPGSIGISYGAMMASMDKIRLRVKGKGAHGAYPQLSVDPILTAAHIVTALQSIVSRSIPPTQEAVVSVCSIHGGCNQNIIPDEVEMEGTVRAASEKTREELAKKIRSLAEGIAGAYGASCEVFYEYKYPPLINDEKFTRFFKRCAEEVMDASKIKTLDRPVMGGEDMAFFLKRVPGTFFFLCNPKAVDGVFHPHHSPKFDVDEEYFSLGIELLLQTVLRFLSQ